MWSEDPQHSMSLVSVHHIDDTPSTSDSVVKSKKGKVRYACLLWKDMHLNYLCPHMDESSKLLEDIIVPKKWIPMGYRKLSIDLPLVDLALPLESEVKVVDSMSFPPDPTLFLESVEIEVVALTQYLSRPSLPIESELKPIEVFIVSSNCSMQE